MGKKSRRRRRGRSEQPAPSPTEVQQKEQSESPLEVQPPTGVQQEEDSVASSLEVQQEEHPVASPPGVQQEEDAAASPPELRPEDELAFGRKLADHWMERLKIGAKHFPDDPWHSERAGCLTMYTDIMGEFDRRDGFVKRRDLKFLTMLKEKHEPAFFRMNALLQLSILYQIEGSYRHQTAVDYIDRALEICDSTSMEQEKERIVNLPGPFKPVIVGDFNDKVRDACTFPERVCRESQWHMFHQYKTGGDPLKPVFPYPGIQCDCCRKHRRDLGFSRLPFCGACKLVYYCSEECQRKAWHNGHKQMCRKPGEFRVGDVVYIREAVEKVKGDVHSGNVEVVGNFTVGERVRMVGPHSVHMGKLVVEKGDVFGVVGAWNLQRCESPRWYLRATLGHFISDVAIEPPALLDAVQQANNDNGELTSEELVQQEEQSESPLEVQPPTGVQQEEDSVAAAQEVQQEELPVASPPGVQQEEDAAASSPEVRPEDEPPTGVQQEEDSVASALEVQQEEHPVASPPGVQQEEDAAASPPEFQPEAELAFGRKLANAWMERFKIGAKHFPDDPWHSERAGCLILYTEVFGKFVFRDGFVKRRDRKFLTMLKKKHEPAFFRMNALLQLSRLYQIEGSYLHRTAVDFADRALEICDSASMEQEKERIINRPGAFEPLMVGVYVDKMRWACTFPERVCRESQCQMFHQYKTGGDPLKPVFPYPGIQCDCCRKHRRDLGFSRLPFCGACKLVYYCSKECQRKAWHNGHKQMCRKPGEFRVGDVVYIREAVKKVKGDVHSGNVEVVGNFTVGERVRMVGPHSVHMGKLVVEKGDVFGVVGAWNLQRCESPTWYLPASLGHNGIADVAIEPPALLDAVQQANNDNGEPKSEELE